MSVPAYVRLDEAAFRQLVAGQVVCLCDIHGQEVRLILSDIGLTRMLRACCDGVEANPFTGDHKC